MNRALEKCYKGQTGLVANQSEKTEERNCQNGFKCERMVVPTSDEEMET